jgi:DNA-binding IscR family transcriptional regulator
MATRAVSEHQAETERVLQCIQNYGHPCNSGDIARYTMIDIRLVKQIIANLIEAHLIESVPERPWVYRPVVRI